MCTFAALRAHDYQGTLQLSSGASTYWKCEGEEQQIAADTSAFTFVEAASKFGLSRNDAKPFMYWAEQEDGKNAPFTTSVHIKAFEMFSNEHCKTCSSRVDPCFAKDEQYWCGKCAKPVKAVRKSHVAQLTIGPDEETDESRSIGCIKDGMRAVAFGSVAAALSIHNETNAIKNTIMLVRMSVRRCEEGVEAQIHAC